MSTKRIVLALSALFLLVATPALADDHRHGRHDGRHDGRWYGDHDRGGDRYHKHRKHHDRKHRRARRHDRHVVWHSGRHWVPPGHRKHHRKVVVHRHHHGHKHHDRYRRHRDDNWALYAILALQIVDVLNESQRDHVAWAQQRAYRVPLGETIQWNDAGASGSIVPLRDGRDTAGRYCREFQQRITVGARSQSGYGVACRQPDGTWEIVS